MALRRAWLWLTAAGLIGGLFAFQRPFREYPGREYEDFPLPPDYQEKTEWAFARLMYPQYQGGGRGYYRGWGRYGGGWTQGRSRWATGYPRADRHFVQALRPLSRVHARAVEQAGDLDD